MQAASFYRKAILLTLPIFTVLLLYCNSLPLEEKRVNVIFRFDDYSAISSTDIELKIIDAFRKHDASVTFGVIPFIRNSDVKDQSLMGVIPLSSEKGYILKSGLEDNTLDIALHGYSHQTIDTFEATEFSGGDYDGQFERLSKGKSFLESMIDAPVTTFLPPWNTYDLNTLRSLELLGFKTLSASIDGPVTKSSHLHFLPWTSDLSQLRDAVKSARMSSDQNSVIVVLFHVYDFIESFDKRAYITYQDFFELLNWLNDQKDVRLLSISQATEENNSFSAHRFFLNKMYTSLTTLLPSALQEKELYLFWQAPPLVKVVLKVCGFYLLFVMVGAFITFYLAFLVFPRSKCFMNICTFGSIALLTTLLIYMLYDLEIYLKGMIICACATGLCVGLCFGYIYVKNHKQTHLN